MFMPQEKEAKKKLVKVPAERPLAVYVDALGKVFCPEAFAKGEKEASRHVNDCKNCPYMDAFGSIGTPIGRNRLTVECEYYCYLNGDQRHSYASVAVPPSDTALPILADPHRLANDTLHVEALKRTSYRDRSNPA